MIVSATLAFQKWCADWRGEKPATLDDAFLAGWAIACDGIYKAAPDQRPDDALIREARDRADDLNPIYDKDLITRLADALERANESREHTQQWYAEKYRALEDWFRNEGKDLPIADQFWSCKVNGTKDTNTPPTYAQLLNIAKHRALAAEAEAQRLTTIIQQHNDGQASSCEWRRNTPGSYADYCAAYTGRDRICPDCPRDNMIDAALRPSSEGGGG